MSFFPRMLTTTTSTIYGYSEVSSHYKKISKDPETGLIKSHVLSFIVYLNSSLILFSRPSSGKMGS